MPSYKLLNGRTSFLLKDGTHLFDDEIACRATRQSGVFTVAFSSDEERVLIASGAVLVGDNVRPGGMDIEGVWPVNPSTGNNTELGRNTGFKFFPACQFMFRYQELSGTLLDSVSGQSIDAVFAIERNGNGARLTALSPVAAVNLPAPFDPADKPFLLLHVFKPLAVGAGVSVAGSISTEHHHILGGTGVAPNKIGAHVNQDQSSGDSATITVNANSTAAIAVLSVPGVSNGEVRLYKTTTGLNWFTETLPVLGFTAHNEYDQITFSGTGAQQVAYMTAGFVFKSGVVPADLEAAIKWMTVEALAGKPALFPGWIGRI